MRVLHVTPSYPRFRGDYHRRFIQDLCCKLAENGVDLKILAPRTRTLEGYPSDFEVRRFPYLPSKRMELLPEQTMKGAPLSHLIQLPFYLASTYLHLMAERATIVHAHLAIPMGFMASLSPRRTPMVLTCHGSDCALPCTSPAYRPFVRHALRRADRVVAVSNFIRDLAIELGASPENVDVIPLGVDTKKFKQSLDKPSLKENIGIPSDHLVVGTLGRLVPEKRVGDLIRAAKTVSGKIDAHFLVGGDGPQRTYLEALAKQLEVGNISFLGRVADAPGFHRLCDVFVLASVREGLSVSLQEAMATSCVPVAVNGFGCPELVREGENGFLFEPGDTESLAEKILSAASNLELGDRARETIERGFDLGVNARRYVELYYELLQES